MSFDISPTGIWLCKDVEPHSFDKSLAEAIVSDLIINSDLSVIDFGCGSGAYVQFMREHHLDAIGYDGNPKTNEFNSHCKVLDLSLPLPRGFESADAVLCLETGEHIPSEFQSQFIENITNMAECTLILSWFPIEGHGIGHVNPRSNKYIEGLIVDRGFFPDDQAREDLREAVTLWWFKESLMVFRRT